MFSVVVPAKDEANCLPQCVRAVQELLCVPGFEFIAVGDKPSLDSVNGWSFVRKIFFDGNMVDAMNVGINEAKNDIVVKLDADITISPECLMGLVTKLQSFDLVSCPATTRGGSCFMNFLFTGRDILQRFTPLGRSSHGNTLIFRKEDLKMFGGFHYDTELDLLYRGAGKRVYVDKRFFAKEFRKDYNLQFIKKRQLESGVKRCKLGVGFKRSVFHAMVRFRPFVVAGWIREHFNEV